MKTHRRADARRLRRPQSATAVIVPGLDFGLIFFKSFSNDVARLVADAELWTRARRRGWSAVTHRKALMSFPGSGAINGRMVATRSGDSEKVHNRLDEFEHPLPRFIAFGGLRRQPSAAGRNQLLKGIAD
jgi:hypothetical protein